MVVDEVEDLIWYPTSLVGVLQQQPRLQSAECLHQVPAVRLGPPQPVVAIHPTILAATHEPEHPHLGGQGRPRPSMITQWVRPPSMWRPSMYDQPGAFAAFVRGGSDVGPVPRGQRRPSLAKRAYSGTTTT